MLKVGDNVEKNTKQITIIAALISFKECNIINEIKRLRWHIDISTCYTFYEQTSIILSIL